MNFQFLGDKGGDFQLILNCNEKQNSLLGGHIDAVFEGS